MALAFALCALALALMPTTYVALLLPAVGVVAAVTGLFMADLTFDIIAPSRAYEQLQGLRRLVLRMTYQWRIADVLLDLGTISVAYVGAYLIRLDFMITEQQFAYIAGDLWQVVPLTYAAFLLAGVYRNVWRYTSISDALRFVNAAGLAGLLAAGLQVLRGHHLSWSIPLLFAILLCDLLIATRFSFHLLRFGMRRLAGNSRRVLIFGAGRTGAAMIGYMRSRRGRALEQVVGFLDDDPFKRGKVIHGSQVFGPLESLERIYQRVRFNEVIIAASSIPEARLGYLRLFAQRNGIMLSTFPLTSRVESKLASEPRVHASALQPSVAD